MVTEAWLPAELSTVVTEGALSRAPLYRRLAEAGIELGRLQHEITAEIAGPRNAQLLGVAIGSALIRRTALPLPRSAAPLPVYPVVAQQVGAFTQSDAALEAAKGSIAHDVHMPSAGAPRLGRSGRRPRGSRGRRHRHGEQVGLFDDADLKFDRDDQQNETDESHHIRCHQGDSEPNTSIAVKIGLRTQPNTPLRTSVVVSLRSTPIRHESPMSSSA